MSEHMNQPGYEPLADILTAAYNQAAVGKGAERHAGGQPFDQQPMQAISDLFDSPYGMAFQVTKKLHEGLKMPTLERQERELLGVIVYTAGIILWLRRQHAFAQGLGDDLRSEIVAKVKSLGGWVERQHHVKLNADDRIFYKMNDGTHGHARVDTLAWNIHHEDPQSITHFCVTK